MNKMRVKRNSWHWKLYSLMRMSWNDWPGVVFEIALRKKKLDTRWIPSSLCAYFWFIVASVVAMPIALVFIGVSLLIFGITAPIWYPIYKYIDRLDEKKSQARVERLRKLREGEISIEEYYAEPEKGDSLFFSFIKAKKDKVCPLIDVID